MLRDGRLFFPWFERRNDHARHIEPDLGLPRLQSELVDVLRAEGAWQKLLAATLDYPTVAMLASQRGPLAIGAAADSAWATATGDAVASRPGLTAHALPRATGQWLPALLDACG